MKEFEIIPKNGVGPIKLGMSRADVESCFGIPEFDNGTRIGYMSGYFIDFDAENNVEFIELSNSDEFKITYSGVDLHNVDAMGVISLIEGDDNYDRSDPEIGYSYVFKRIGLSLWRGTIPEGVEDTDGKYFEAIGVAIEGYF